MCSTSSKHTVRYSMKLIRDHFSATQKNIQFDRKKFLVTNFVPDVKKIIVYQPTIHEARARLKNLIAPNEKLYVYCNLRAKKNFFGYHNDIYLPTNPNFEKPDLITKPSCMVFCDVYRKYALL
ncbi:hypothetical protein MXB_3651 [Myxobolus squamalis]|nr:hypothetical protein MXB_3651 [Myxobolus squamalis]